MMYLDVTVVLTSCGRLDLLEKTIKSLPLFFWHRLPHRILVDDSGDPEVHRELERQKESGYLIGWHLLLHEKNLGQGHAIDHAYERVSTPYIFHMEDDWEFIEYEFISRSLVILEQNPKLCQVTFRGNSPHPREKEIRGMGDTQHQILAPEFMGMWHGFTYNPNVFRKSCYDIVKPIGDRREQDVGYEYYKNGLRTAITVIDSVRHIGDGRHVG
jgi:hypothetical protein